MDSARPAPVEAMRNCSADFSPKTCNSSKESDMKSKATWALVVLNALLLGNLAFRGLTPVAHAQAGGARPSDYLMITGEVVGGNSALVYIVDTRNGLLNARAVDPNTKQLVDVMQQPIDLNRDMGRR